MNCKSGDLALVVKGMNVGKMVQCIRLFEGDTYRGVTGFERSNPFWLLDREVVWKNTITGELFNVDMLPDSSLLPIRPPDDDVKSNEKDELYNCKPCEIL